MKFDLKVFVVFTVVLLTVFLLPCDAAFTKKTKFSVQNMTVQKGKHFLITLKSNPTTGYSWTLVRPVNRNFLRLMGSNFVPKKTGLVGSPGEELWTFKAVKKGKTSLMFSCQRSWEKDKPPVEVVKFIISIK